MEWKVTNALNRDVERQNLNKILAEIRAAINSASATNTNNTPTNIQDVVGTMVSGNKESGITVSYNSAAKLLDFVISSFTLRLTGDIEGSATINGLQSATIETVLNPSLHGVEEAPIDNNFYWRQNAAWEPVDQGLSSFAQLRGTGFPAQRQDATEGESLWDLRTLQPPAAGITITNPDGEAGDPTFGLANDLAALEGLGSTGIAVRTAADTWAQRQIDVAVGELTISNPAGVAGNPTLGLADVTDSGVGVTPMRLFTRDSKGRISGTQAASTTDLTEGSNLYFTAARVLSTVLTGLSTATNAVITAADTVLTALGKLQAQITANAATIAGLVIDSIADSDTTHAPSRNAVFDALALKLPSTVSINIQNTTAYTLVATDAHTSVRMNSGSANVCTIPPNSSVPFPLGTRVWVEQANTGATTVSPGAGVTFRGAGAVYSPSAQFGVVGWLKTNTDTWTVISRT